MSDLKPFKLKHFELLQSSKVFKIGTDALVLGAWINCPFEPKKILDLGTGSGILSLMMAQKYPKASITAIDIDNESIKLAELNFKSNTISKNCTTIETSFDNFKSPVGYDWIISNPPFFLDSKRAETNVNKRAKHIDQMMLNSFFDCIRKNLTANGIAALIYPVNSEFEIFAEKHGLFVKKRLDVFGKPENPVRHCALFSLEQVNYIPKESLTIRDKNGNYTEAYKQLTIDFHGVSL